METTRKPFAIGSEDFLRNQLMYAFNDKAEAMDWLIYEPEWYFDSGRDVCPHPLPATWGECLEYTRHWASKRGLYHVHSTTTTDEDGANAGVWWHRSLSDKAVTGYVFPASLQMNRIANLFVSITSKNPSPNVSEASARLS